MIREQRTRKQKRFRQLIASLTTQFTALGAGAGMRKDGNDDERHGLPDSFAPELMPDDFLELNVWQQLARDMDEFPLRLIGSRIGHYEILSFVGAGGMGQVFKALDLQLQRYVAIKILPAEFTADPARVRRFEQEAYAASALNHPGIVTIYEVGQVALGGQPLHYIAYELVEGQTLRERLQQVRLSWPEIVGIAIQIADALKAAHHAGIIHRDIKPENVMLRADGRVKVLDFGIAKRLDVLTVDEPSGGTDVAPVSANSTLTSGVLGTLSYLAPEQARGERIDARADIFALGMMLYEMLAGGHPFAARRNEEKLAALLNEQELPAINQVRQDLPAALSLLVTQALKPRRSERYAAIAPMLDALNELKPAVERKAPTTIQRHLRTQNANRLLNQFVALYATDQQTRLSPVALWTIWRYADIKHGRLEKALLRRSLFSALGKASAIALLAGVATLAVTAWYSIEEQWEEKILQDGHADMIRDIALAPDGKTLVSVGNDKAAIVWDVARAERRATLKFEQARYVGAVAYAPDGKWFATASTDSKVTVWDAAQLRKVKELPGEEGGIQGVLAFASNGRLLVTQEQIVKNSQQKMLNFWEVETWRLAGKLPSLGNLLVSPDSRVLLGHFWRTFDLATMKETTRQRAEESFGTGAFSPDAQRIAITDKGGFVSFWDLRRFWTAGERRLIARYAAHRDRGRAIAYSPDGRLVASGSDNIIVWDAATHAKLARFTHRDLVTGLEFSPDSKQLLSSHGDGAILVWDLAEKEVTTNFAAHSGVVRTVSVALDGQLIASASEDRSIILWDATSGLKRGVLWGHDAPVAAAAFAADGRHIASSDIYGRAIWWDVAMRQPLRHFAPPRKKEDDLGFCIAISPDQKWMATTFGVYAVADGRLVVDALPLRDIMDQAIRGAAFSPDGRWLAGVASDGRIFLWEVGSWQLREAKVAENMVSVAFAPDSRTLVAGHNSGALRLWEVESLREIGLLGQHTATVESVAFSPDGRLLASASADETVKLWDVTGRRFLRHIGTHKPSVLAVAFAPDGNRLVTGEHDRSVRVYTRRRALWGWRLD